MLKSIYIAGPMRGIPQFNFPSFTAARTRLREAGWEVRCPAERSEYDGFDPSKYRGTEDPASIGFGMTEALAVCFKDVLEVEAVALLPGWARSEGARAEALIGLLSGKELYGYFHHRPHLLEPMNEVKVLTRVEAL
jgi:hypothetical protein